MKRLLITICGRAGSKGFKNKNLKNFCGKPLVYYSLSAAELFIKKHPELEIDVALNTDSEDLARLVAAEYPEVIYLPRGTELGGDRVPKVEVYKDSFARMEALASKQYDAMIDLDITSPLRTEQDIENAFAKAQEREDLQIIFSVCEARRNPWFNMFKIVGDHAEMVIESQFTGRQQAPEVYDVNASIYGQLTGKLVHGLDAAQMDRHGGHVPHQRDGIPPRQVRRRKDAVGQNIDMEVPHAEAGGHDLHGLLRAEHLAAVFQQRLACVHDQLQRTVKQCISHGYSPAQR